MRIFADRIESQKNFWASYDELINTGSTIITFYGAGGVGKMSLANAVANFHCSRRATFICSSSRAEKKLPSNNLNRGSAKANGSLKLKMLWNWATALSITRFPL